MLINQKELETLCLTTNAINELGIQVFNQFQGIEDPLVRYAIARVLNNVLEDVRKRLAMQAETFCEDNEIGTSGKDFVHEGLWFNRQFNLSYDYAHNDTDEEGNPLYYTKAVATRDKAKKSYDLSKAVVKNMEKIIELAHPNMKPTVESVVLKFQGTVLDFPE